MRLTAVATKLSIGGPQLTGVCLHSTALVSLVSARATSCLRRQCNHCGLALYGLILVFVLSVDVASLSEKRSISVCNRIERHFVVLVCDSLLLFLR